MHAGPRLSALDLPIQLPPGGGRPALRASDRNGGRTRASAGVLDIRVLVFFSLRYLWFGAFEGTPTGRT